MEAAVQLGRAVVGRLAEGFLHHEWMVRQLRLQLGNRPTPITDRTRLQQLGLSAFNVGQNVLVSLSGSSQTAPAFWLNPQNGVVYNITVQTPQYKVDSLDALLNTPVTGGGGGTNANPQLLGNLVQAGAARQPAVVSRYNILPAVDVFVSVQGSDLANVAGKVQKLVDEVRPKLPRGSQVVMRGQVLRCARCCGMSRTASGLISEPLATSMGRRYLRTAG